MKAVDTKISQEIQATASSAGLIGLATFGGALIGFVLQLLVAFHFGASSATDAYFMALSTSEMLSKLLLGGSITAVFIPMFVERITQKRAPEAWHLALNILHLSAIVMVTLLVLLAIFAEPFIRFIAPGFAPPTTQLTVRLLHILLPSFLLLFLVQLATSMLHALKQFTIPALLRILAPAASIVSIVVLIRPLGIFSLAIGVVVGSLLQLLLLLWDLRRHGFSYRFILKPFDPAIKKLLHLVYPFIFSVLITQGAGITYRILVSDLAPGSLTALKFAEKITQMLTILFLNSVTLVIYPLLSEKASRRDYVGMRTTIASSMRLIAFTTIPVIIGIVLLREQLVTFVYQRGLFTPEDVALTSSALLFLILGLTANGIGSVLGYTTLALQETRASVAISIATQAIAISLFVLLVPVMSHAGLALASSLVPVSISILYFVYLTRFIPKLWRIFYHPTYSKTLLLAVILAVTIQGAVWLAQQIPALPAASQAIQLFFASLTGSFVFFGGAYLWRIPEMHTLTTIISSKLKKWRRQQQAVG